MRLRKLTWINWFEVIFGALVPTLFWAPGLALGLITGLDVGVQQLMELGPLFLLLGGACALVALWMVLLFGSEQIVARHHLRIFIVASGLLGYAATIWLAFIFFEDSLGGGSAWTTLFIFAPAVVSLRYLPALVSLK